MRGGAYDSAYGGSPYDRGPRWSTRHGLPYRTGGAHARPRPHPDRRGVALAVVFGALVAWALFAGPAAAASTQGPCALRRTDARHSEGVADWNAAYPRPLGDLDAVMIFLAFPDHTPGIGTAELAADHFPGTSRFFARASYGRFRLRAHIEPRWITMPRPSSAYRIHRDWAAGPRDAYLRDAVAVAGRTVDLGRYPVVYLVADPDAPGVDSDATKVVNLDRPLRSGGAEISRLVTVFERHPPDPDVLAHETNHVFDLPDLYFRPPPGDTDDWDTRVGDWDLMGSQFALAPDLFAWHRWKYGWIDRAQVTCFQHPGTTTADLTPVETAGGAKLVVVRLDATSALAVEARTADGNDVRACAQGVLLYRIRSDVATGEGPVEVVDPHPLTGGCYGSSVYPPLADAPLASGESYTYRFGVRVRHAVRIRVAGRTARGGWRVTVAER